MDAPIPNRPDRRARSAALALTLALFALAGGCAQPGPLARRRATFGSLKASVAQLETENEQYRRQVADLQSEKRRLEDRVVEEDSNNGELTARLNDALNVIRHQGLETTPTLAAPSPDPDRASPRRTSPAKRPRNHPAPFTQIPGLARPVPEDSSEPEIGDDQTSRDDTDDRRSDERQARARWLPVARGIRPSPVVR